MTQAEKAATLDAYRLCLLDLEYHASMCTEAHTLRMDLEASLRRRMGEVEAIKPAQKIEPMDTAAIAAAFEQGSGEAARFGHIVFSEDGEGFTVKFHGAEPGDVVTFVRPEPFTPSHTIDLAYLAGRRLAERVKPDRKRGK